MFKKSFSTLNFCSRRCLSINQPCEIDWAKQEKLLMEPFEHIHKLRSKYALMSTSFDHWLQIPKEKFDAIQEAMHTCMTWTMLLDDIQDDSNYRFGLPSAHRVFGTTLTINAAYKGLLLSQKQIADLGHPSAVEIFWKVNEEFFYGAGVDFYWKQKNIIPSEQEQIEMTRKKSGSYFALPVELMQLFSDNKTDYKDLAMDVGTYYAIVDDYYNLFLPNALQTLATSEKRDKQNYAPPNDITESKMTLAIVHAAQFPDVATELADILKQQTSDLNLVNRALSLIRKHDSDKYVRDVLKKMDAEIRAEILVDVSESPLKVVLLAFFFTRNSLVILMLLKIPMEDGVFYHQIDRLGGNPKLVAFLDSLSIY